jgi:hypothetical protein
MRSLENSLQGLRRHRVRPEATDVTALGDDAMDRCAVVVWIPPSRRIAGPLSGP